MVDVAGPADAEQLGALLAACVDDGASVGFLSGLTAEQATAWWRAVLAGPAVVLIAREGGTVVGTVTLVPSAPANGAHRAEVVKLLVHPTARRRGLAGRLLAAVESAARDLGRDLLVLDTETGSPAQALYERTGWQVAGVVPDYAARPDGVLAPTTVMWRVVPPAAGQG